MKRILTFSVLALTALTARGQAWGDISELKSGVSESRCNWGNVVIQPGDEYELARFEGAGAITYFYITDGPTGMHDRNLVLRVYWDGNSFPSVNVPAADFFGAIDCRTVDYESLWFVVNHNQYQCFFPMPFSRGARVVLYNDGDKPYVRDVAYNFDAVADKSYARNTSRFHAVWNRSNPTNGLHTILDVQGRGHYVGNILHVYTQSRRWWGEGDTDFTVDGRTMKHTPGTEDEYGSCFDFGGRFSYLTCGYIQGGTLVDEQTHEYSYYGNNRMYRFYAANPVRFTRGLKVTLENQYVAPNTPYDFKGQAGANDDYTSVAFYYLDGAHSVELAPYAERIAASRSTIY